MLTSDELLTMESEAAGVEDADAVLWPGSVGSWGPVPGEEGWLIKKSLGLEPPKALSWNDDASVAEEEPKLLRSFQADMFNCKPPPALEVSLPAWDEPADSLRSEEAVKASVVSTVAEPAPADVLVVSATTGGV